MDTNDLINCILSKEPLRNLMDDIFTSKIRNVGYLSYGLLIDNLIKEFANIKIVLPNLDYTNSESFIRFIDNINEIGDVAYRHILSILFRNYIRKKDDRADFLVYYLKRVDFPVERFDQTDTIYNYNLSDIYLINDLTMFIKVLSLLNTKYYDESPNTERYSGSKARFFYRGHNQLNYTLYPNLFRKIDFEEKEDVMYKEIMIRNPKDFSDCKTNIDRLVKMQHYGLPTRLLDITSNPLVALYFACGDKEKYGEFIIIESEQENIKFPWSDTVALLSSLPQFKYNEKQTMYLNTSKRISEFSYTKDIGKMVYEVRTEKPGFEKIVDPKSLLSNVIVRASMNNERIIRQSGSFILCGLNIKDLYALEYMRFLKNNKKQIIIINNKEGILSELDTLNINKATLFPELDHVTSYIKDNIDYL